MTVNGGRGVGKYEGECEWGGARGARRKKNRKQYNKMDKTMRESERIDPPRLYWQ
jgi:hypothetical protein